MDSWLGLDVKKKNWNSSSKMSRRLWIAWRYIPEDRNFVEIIILRQEQNEILRDKNVSADLPLL
jgi:hypothetical protein